MINFYVLVVFLCCLVSALAQIASKGSCPEIEIMQDFDISKFLGKWYELEQYFIPTMDHIQCVTYDWRSDENGNTIRVETIMSLRTGIRVSTPGVITIPNSIESGKMKQKYVWSTMESDYWILATDYESYAVAYNCIDRNLMHNQFAWIMTRDENPSDCVMTKIADVLEQHKLNRSKFTKTNHDDCEVSYFSRNTIDFLFVATASYNHLNINIKQDETICMAQKIVFLGNVSASSQILYYRYYTGELWNIHRCFVCKNLKLHYSKEI